MGKSRTLVVTRAAPSCWAVAATMRSGVLMPGWLRLHFLPISPASRAMGSSRPIHRISSKRRSAAALSAARSPRLTRPERPRCRWAVRRAREGSRWRRRTPRRTSMTTEVSRMAIKRAGGVRSPLVCVRRLSSVLGRNSCLGAGKERFRRPLARHPETEPPVHHESLGIRFCRGRYRPSAARPRFGERHRRWARAAFLQTWRGATREAAGTAPPGTFSSAACGR